MLIKAWLHFTWGIALQWPVAGRIWGEYFITKHQRAIFIDTKLKLGISQDHATLQRYLCSTLVDGDGGITELVCAGFTQALFHHIKRDVDVMITNICLSGRGENWFWKLGGLHQSFRQLYATDRLGLLVFRQSRAGEVTTYDTFKRQHVELLADHCSSENFFWDARVIWFTSQVVGEIDGVKEELAHRSEHSTFIGDLGIEDEIISRDTVGSHHEDVAFIDLVDLTDLACRQVLVLGEFRTHG